MKTIKYKDAKNNPKEARMKKLVLVLLAVFLVIPALSNAGSVSSKYDVTFGGFVKYDLGYSTQNSHADPGTAYRSSGLFRDSRADEYGNTFSTAGETRFNFLVKGPDLWGAKTSAFIEGDFRGTTTQNQNGGFQLRHAFMSLNWQSAELMIGQNWQQWGMPYYPAMIGNNDFAQYLKGIRTPQMALRFFMGKEFNAMFGITSATEWSGATRQFNDDYARSSWPGVMGEIAYWSDRCGKIGPNNLKFALGGVFGRESKTYAETTTVGGIPVSGTVKDSTLDAWLTAFRYSVPIIPEKQGNKAMALLLNGNFFYGANVAGNNWLSPGAPSPSNGSYFRNASMDAAAPTVFGLYTQGTFWLTNTLQVNAMYGYLKYQYSGYARDTNVDNVNMMQTYAVNLLWDANQAIRFGVQWMSMFTGFNRPGLGASNGTAGVGNLDRTGQIDQYRFVAYYFF